MIPREKVNILLVDDQPAKLLSLETILAELDENVLVASSADEALKVLLSRECAVVLVDVCMPNMDGFELAELIRSHPRFGRTAIIFISAVYLTDADRLRGYNLGAVDYMPVPIIPEVLRAKVAVFAELFRKTSELQRVNTELQQRIEELDRSNERLRIADRMATIGTLAAGLGHDMGNLLLPVRMRLDTLGACDLPPEAHEDITAIREAAEYLQQLARSLRLLSLDCEAEIVTDASTPLASWWQETEGMFRSSVAGRSTLTAEIAPDLPPVRMSKAALTQAVFNLIQNASDALKSRDNGRICFAASLSEPSTIRITVSDNGPGMSSEAQRRCLEPFFTTKTRELSTGLGLALVDGLVKRAKGAIQIHSQVGAGTTFALLLPACGGVPHHHHPMQRPAAVISLKNERLRAHIRSILASLDYDISTTPSAETCLLVTEADHNGALEAARQFADSSPARRSIVFAAPSEVSQRHPRLLPVNPDTRPSALRAQIRELLLVDGPVLGSAE